MATISSCAARRMGA